MKLKLDTRINMIMFKETDSNTLILSKDLNMEFSEYLELPKTPKLLLEMLKYDFNQLGSYNTNDSLGNKITINSYKYVSSDLTCGFMEIKYH